MSKYTKNTCYFHKRLTEIFTDKSMRIYGAHNALQSTQAYGTTDKHNFTDVATNQAIPKY